MHDYNKKLDLKTFRKKWVDEAEEYRKKLEARVYQKQAQDRTREEAELKECTFQPNLV